MSIWSEIKRRNVLKVGAAYLVAAWLLVQIAATVAPQLQLPEWAPRLITLLLMLGFPIALLIAWFLEHTPEGLKVEPAAAGNKRMVGVAIALVALAVGWYLREVREMGSESLSGREPVAGGDVAGIATRSRDSRRLGWNPEYWEAADFLAEALLDDRAAGNRRAAAIDAMPGGPLKLAIQLSRCQCGVPFDLEVVPNFKARVAESGLSWPPPDLIAGLRRARPPAP